MIIAVLLTVTIYGFVAGKHRLRVFILSVYVGIVLAGQLADIVAPKFTMLGADQVAMLLLCLPILVLGMIGLAHKKAADKGSAIANLLLGLGTGALIIAAALHLLPTSEMSAIDSDSFLATMLQQYYLWILGLLPVAALVLGWVKGEKAGR
ncbi:MAG TPA: hypothetical protein VHQ86_06030 [Candidatus Saccharimonadia bacterium]|nr:hypothetical protein [Candidatus Saccharimonadia bacterium]